MTRSRSIVFSILLLTITAATASAQSIQFGVKAGTNIFKLSGRSFDNKFYFGFSGGVYADIGLVGRLGLQPELLYNESSAKTSDQFNQIYVGGASFQNATMNYISLPILVTFKVSDAFTALIGPQYGYMVYQTQGLVQDPPQRTTQIFQKNDFSILFGGQLKLGKMGIGARYVIGFTQLNNLDDNIDSWKNHGLQLYLTYKLK
jgi:hypothetical protein